MSGAFCETCKFYNQYPIVRDSGECKDPAKIIFSKHGSPTNSHPEVASKNYCSNYEDVIQK